jgi:glycerate-2-kinase
MLSLPTDDITLEDQINIARDLLYSGASIQEINTVRKHLSQVKGGLLGKYFQPTPIISLILSDVLDDNTAFVASGPTSPDSTTFIDVRSILQKYDLFDNLPKNILRHIKQGVIGHGNETPRTLDNCHNHVVGNNNLALQAMKQYATSLGYKTKILSAIQSGDTNIIATQIRHEITQWREKKYNAFLMGFETSPRLPLKHGVGGRNQHYVAHNLLDMQDAQGLWTMASINTDGHDAKRDIAGAIIDIDSIRIAKEMKLNIGSYLDNYDSHSLLDRIDDCLIETHPTHTNVSDLAVYLFNVN